MRFVLPLFVFFLLVTTPSQAQTDTTILQQPVKVKKKNAFVTGLAYTSPLHYFGRVDSLSSSAFIPTAVLLLKSGFYINGNLVFIQNQPDGIDYAASTAGIGFRKYKQQGFGYALSVDKFFYKEQTGIVQSAFDGQASATISWMDSAVNFHLGATSTFSENTDINARATIEHAFKFKKKKTNFSITPGFTANAGTQNYTRSYFKNTGVIPLPGGPQEQVLENSSRFTVLSYEVAAPVIITHKKLIFSLTPAYVLPQNLVKVENRPDLSERGKNLFYVVAAAFLKFDL